MAETDIYPSNSNKSKEASLICEARVEAKPAEPVDISPAPAKTSAPARRISPVREVFHAIFPGGVQELKEHIIWDVFVPWMQDAFHNGWDAVGDVLFPGSSARTSGSPVEHVSYDQQYRLKSQRVSYDEAEQYGMRPVTQSEADDILRSLRGIQRRYGVVTLLDFNELVGNQTRPTQRAYGWINLNAADIVRVGANRYVVKMPPAVPIDS